MQHIFQHKTFSKEEARKSSIILDASGAGGKNKMLEFGCQVGDKMKEVAGSGWKVLPENFSYRNSNFLLLGK